MDVFVSSTNIIILGWFIQWESFKQYLINIIKNGLKEFRTLENDPTQMGAMMNLLYLIQSIGIDKDPTMIKV